MNKLQHFSMWLVAGYAQKSSESRSMSFLKVRSSAFFVVLRAVHFRKWYSRTLSDGETVEYCTGAFEVEIRDRVKQPLTANFFISSPYFLCLLLPLAI